MRKDQLMYRNLEYHRVVDLLIPKLIRRRWDASEMTCAKIYQVVPRLYLNLPTSLFYHQMSICRRR